MEKVAPVTYLQPDEYFVNGEIVKNHCDENNMPSIIWPIIGLIFCCPLGIMSFIKYQQAHTAQGNWLK